MTTVVCDASPLIFLAKLDRLDLIARLPGERVVVLQCVAEELDSEQAGRVEAARLSCAAFWSARRWWRWRPPRGPRAP